MGGSANDVIREGPGMSTITAGAGDDLIRLFSGGEGDVVQPGTGADRIIIENAIGPVLLDASFCYPPTFSFFPVISETQPPQTLTFRNPDLTEQEVTIDCDALVNAGIGWEVFGMGMNANPPGTYTIELDGVHWSICRVP